MVGAISSTLVHYLISSRTQLYRGVDVGKRKALGRAPEIRVSMVGGPNGKPCHGWLMALRLLP